MHSYIGTKRVNATLMDRGTYNSLRGLQVPAGENPDDEGYLVEYTDGGKPNHADFKGYISWSPKDVFERAYKIIVDRQPEVQGRLLTDHIVNPANDKLVISVTDVPGAGGANHRYVITGFNMESNSSTIAGDHSQDVAIVFQNGPINEVGVNGVTHEALLAIVADRLRSFQSGPFACRENDQALAKIEEAQHWLQQRTIARMRRGVEGTHTV